LPAQQQYHALSLADKLRSISGSLAAGRNWGRRTSTA
jgi:hypothetical protein